MGSFPSIFGTTLSAGLPEDEARRKALQGTFARLLSCLVTEGLCRASFRTVDRTAVVYNGQNLREADILCVVPLSETPVLLNDTDQIVLLDPMDMDTMNGIQVVLEDAAGSQINSSFSSQNSTQTSSFKTATANDLDLLWFKFASRNGLSSQMTTDILAELHSSVLWQMHSYIHPPLQPNSLFDSTPIEWEQSILEGHPTHPMHKSRMFVPPLPLYAPEDNVNLLNPKLRFIGMPAEDLYITAPGPGWDELVHPLLELAELNSGQKMSIPLGLVVIPVHELEVIHIQDKFPQSYIFPGEFWVSLQAQQSIRSVIVNTPSASPSSFYRSHHLKLALGLKLTSAVRTISPASAFLGPRFSHYVVPHLHLDETVVKVAKEVTSAVSRHPNNDIAKFCACLVREAHELQLGDDERGIVCTALVERPGHDEVSNVVRLFGLDTIEKRREWLEEFVRLFLRAFIPTMIKNGVGFEAHPQNCIAIFSISDLKIKRFIIRDFGGIRIHPPTLQSSTGIDVFSPSNPIVSPGHSILAETIDDVYTRMYHTVFHNHFQQLIRVMGLHYNGVGWDVVRLCVRQELNRCKLVEGIEADRVNALERCWLGEGSETQPGKCFMRMRMTDMYRFHLHAPFPNLIHYRGAHAAMSQAI